MPDENGVTTWAATRLQMIDALRQLPALAGEVQPQPRRRPSLRRTPAPQRAVLPLAVPDMADAILARLPEAGPAQEIGDEEFAAAQADLIRRFGAVPPALQRVVDRGGRFGMPATTWLADTTVVTTLGEIAGKDADIARLTGRAEQAEAEAADLRAAARPGRAQDEPVLDLAYLEDLTGRAERAEAKLSHAIGALEWFAAPGAMSATARRQRASEVLSFLDAAAAGEQVAADEPA
jgi:hypothetical protein